jgi:hypothetical protein
MYRYHIVNSSDWLSLSPSPKPLTLSLLYTPPPSLARFCPQLVVIVFCPAHKVLAID